MTDVIVQLGILGGSALAVAAVVVILNRLWPDLWDDQESRYFSSKEEMRAVRRRREVKDA